MASELIELKRQLQAIEAEESRLDLTANIDLSGLDYLKPVIKELVAVSSGLKQRLDKTADLAESISAKVRELDRQQASIQQSLRQVNDAQQLRTCVEGVQLAMKAGEHENAAVYLKTFLEFDPQTVTNLLENSTFNASQQNHQINASTARSIIESSKGELLRICIREFEHASRSKDEARLLQFWRLFPMIGESELGLEKLGGYLTACVREKIKIPPLLGERNGPTFSDLLTQLFELLASLLDSQDAKISEHYGPGRMLYISRLFEQEADLQVGKILDVFSEKRSLARKIKEWQQTIDEAHIKDLALVLEEIAAISHRIHLFQRFLTVRAKDDLELLTKAERKSEVKAMLETNAYKYSPVTGLAKLSGTTARLRELLNQYYVPFETIFLQQSIQKALRIDSYDSKVQDEPISSCVEDVFFIAKRVLLRACATQNGDTLCAIMNYLGQSLETDYLRNGLLKRIQTGFSTSTLLERPDTKISYMVLLNNLNRSEDYLGKLCDELDGEIGKRITVSQDAEARGKESEKIASCLSSIQDLSTVIHNSLRIGVETLFNTTVKPRLRTLFNDFLPNARYNLSDEDYTAQSTKEDPMQRFLNVFTPFIGPGDYSRFLTESNYFHLLTLCAEQLAADWERNILPAGSAATALQSPAIKFNTTGAMRFDKHLRSLISGLNGLLPYGSIRESMVRMTQISLLIGMESASEYTDYARDGTDWRLNPMEIRQTLLLRFSMDQVSRLAI